MLHSTANLGVIGGQKVSPCALKSIIGSVSCFIL